MSRCAANDLVGKSDAEVREVIGDKFPKHIYYSIVCIGTLVGEELRRRWSVSLLRAASPTPGINLIYPRSRARYLATTTYVILLQGCAFVPSRFGMSPRGA